jgi:hypothetical protein
MKTLLLTLALAGLVWAQKAPAVGSDDDEKIAISAKLYMDHDAVVKLLGSDPGPNLYVIAVIVTPKAKGPYYLDQDEFLLRADNDGEHTRPAYPAEIAGTSVMVVRSAGGTQGQARSEQRRVPYGMPIPGQPGPPPTLPGTQPPVVGSSTADTSEAQASIEEKPGDAQQKTLLAVLKQKAMPVGEVNGPVSGLLYFPMEGKHKVKHMELLYRKAPPRLSIRFEEPKKK